MEVNEKFCGNCGFKSGETLSITTEQVEKSSVSKETGDRVQDSHENFYYDTSPKKQAPELNYCQDCGHAETKGVLYCQACKSERLQPSVPKSYFPPKRLKKIAGLQIGVAAFNVLLGLGYVQAIGPIFGIIYLSMSVIVIIFVALLLAKVALSRSLLSLIFILECILNFGIGTIIGIPMLIYLGRPRVRAFLSNPYYKEADSTAI